MINNYTPSPEFIDLLFNHSLYFSDAPGDMLELLYTAFYLGVLLDYPHN